MLNSTEHEIAVAHKAKMLKNKPFSKLSDVASIMLTHVKMSTIDGISTFMSMINFMRSNMEHKRCINSGLGEVR